jgi:hypothetical protein
MVFFERDFLSPTWMHWRDVTDRDLDALLTTESAMTSRRIAARATLPCSQGKLAPGQIGREAA